MKTLPSNEKAIHWCQIAIVYVLKFSIICLCNVFLPGCAHTKSSSSSILLSDAQNNTGLDWALTFVGQDNTKQPGIT